VAVIDLYPSTRHRHLAALIKVLLQASELNKPKGITNNSDFFVRAPTIGVSKRGGTAQRTAVYGHTLGFEHGDYAAIAEKVPI
jgi:hypothetical protein